MIVAMMFVWAIPQLVSAQIFKWMVDADFGVLCAGATIAIDGSSARIDRSPSSLRCSRAAVPSPSEEGFDAGDLPRARYFVPPKIGTTVTLAIASLWLVPVSVVVALFAVIGSVAGSF